MASLSAAVEAEALADVTVALKAVVDLRAQLSTDLAVVIGQTRSDCTNSVSRIDLAVAGLVDLVVAVSAQVKTQLDAESYDACHDLLSLIASLRAQIVLGVQVGGSFGSACSNVIAKLDASLSASVTVVCTADTTPN